MVYEGEGDVGEDGCRIFAEAGQLGDDEASGVELREVEFKFPPSQTETRVGPGEN